MPAVSVRPAETDVCLLQDSSASRNLTLQTQPWRRSPTAAWVAGLLAVLLSGCCMALLAPLEGPAIRTIQGKAPQVIQAQQDPTDCRMWFAIGQDCSKKNYWECVGDDGSTGFKCCCKYGWGDFEVKDNHAVGMINWATHPERCLDLSMPYVGSGVPFESGHAYLWGCNWGNPNKQFRVPLVGNGLIQWATHPNMCLGVKDGAVYIGNEIRLQNCWIGDSSWKQWDMSSNHTEPHQIRWVAHPEMCLDVQGSQNGDGVKIQLANCKKEFSSQKFVVSLPPPPVAWANVPKLFCISVMLPTGYEAGLLKDQHAKGVGIFECNEYAVYSNKSISLTSGKKPVKTVVMNGSLACAFGGEWHSALNTDIFIRFWARVIKDPRAWRNEWIVKIDPDAVFFPSRLREILRNKWDSGNPKKGVYLNNCHRGMHGPIEVISKQALATYRKNWTSCKDGPPYEHKQEDYYFRVCWEFLGIERVDVYNLCFENLYACDERSDTRDGRHPCFSRQVSFHPYKTKESYFQCYNRANAMRWVAPMAINSQEPGKINFHHA